VERTKPAADLQQHKEQFEGKAKKTCKHHIKNHYHLQYDRHPKTIEPSFNSN